MFNWIQGVLNQEDIGAILDILATSEFVDGKKTAGYRAKRVKENEQLKKDPASAATLDSLILDALKRSATFQSVAVPKRIHRPLFSRYSAGQQYGKHVDDALMDKPNALRTDLAVTVFLSDPEDYDGGELVIDTALGEQLIKLPQGDAIAYPASTLHRVAPVTRGERLAAVTWVQSYVRDADKREALSDLDKVKRYLDQHAAASQTTDLAHKVYSNLLRIWAEV